MRPLSYLVLGLLRVLRGVVVIAHVGLLVRPACDHDVGLHVVVEFHVSVFDFIAFLVIIIIKLRKVTRIRFANVLQIFREHGLHLPDTRLLRLPLCLLHPIGHYRIHQVISLLISPV